MAAGSVGGKGGGCAHCGGDRQREVFDLVRRGLDTFGIAEHLGIAPDTVRIHLGTIYRHYGVKSRLALLAKVRESA